MKIRCYEEIFKVTETLQNGKERTVKKSVLCPIFRNGRHVIELDRVGKAEQALREQGFYKIEHIETKFKTFLATGDLTAE